MKYKVSYAAQTFETMFKTIVKKIISKNYEKYSKQIQEEIDVENIFSSIFQGFDINELEFQKKLGEVINPNIENGEFVKMIEPESYWRIVVQHMINNSFSETLDNKSVSFKEHYEDILMSVCKQPKFAEKHSCLSKFYEINFEQSRSRNLISILMNGNYHQWHKIYTEGKVFDKNWEKIKTNLFQKNGDLTHMVNDIFERKFRELIHLFSDTVISSRSIMDNAKKAGDKEVEFYKSILIDEIDNLIGKITTLIPAGNKEEFINSINILSHLEVEKKLKGRYDVKEQSEYVKTVQKIFNAHREKSLDYKINSNVFERLPSLNGIKYNKNIMDISCLGASVTIKHFVENIISYSNMLDNERILFKSMRIKETSKEINILFNFKEAIPEKEKMELLNALEDIIVECLKPLYENGQWYFGKNSSQYNDQVYRTMSQNFLDINNEACLRLKLSKMPKEELIRTKKKL